MKNLTIKQLWKLLAMSIAKTKKLKQQLLQSEAKNKELLNEYYSQTQYYEHQLKELRKELAIKDINKQFIRYA